MILLVMPTWTAQDAAHGNFQKNPHTGIPASLDRSGCSASMAPGNSCVSTPSTEDARSKMLVCVLNIRMCAHHEAAIQRNRMNYATKMH